MTILIYLCHFLLKPTDHTAPALYLIDLHRLQIRKKTPPRWIIKDLAQLHYSALNLLTKTDMLRFLLQYFNTKKLTKKQKRLIPPILRKSNQIAAHDRKLRLKKT
ncbi:MAG: hypothetical protein IID32_09455 [Planctomycetes bacterium]|nr:hypothetical protein [Planctomycetota bacterium]